MLGLLAVRGARGDLGPAAADELRARRGLRLLPPQRATPPAASLPRTDAVCREVDRILTDTPGIGGFNTIVGFSLLTRVTASNNGFYFVGLARGDERAAPGLDARSIVNHLNARCAKEAAARAAPSRPCRRRSLGSARRAASRSGCRIAAAARSSSSMPISSAFSRRRASVRSWSASRRPSARPCRRSSSIVDRDKALKQGVAIGDVYQTMQTFLGGLFVNQFNRFGRQWRVFLQAEGRTSRTARRHRPVLRAQQRRRDGAALVARDDEADVGPQYTDRFNLYRAVQITGAAAPGYSSGQALDALEDVAADDAAARDGLRLDRSLVPGAEGRRRRGADLRAVARSSSSSILAALYESWSLPFSVLLSVPVAVFGAFLGPAVAPLRPRRLRADRPGHAGRPGREERDPDRRVREGELENGQPLVDAALEGARCACGRS